jgi:hypothetical protein
VSSREPHSPEKDEQSTEAKPAASPGSGEAEVLAPERIREIVNLRADPLSRLKQLRSLKQPLNEGEVNALFGFLGQRHAEDESQLGHVIKNEIMDTLSAISPLPSGCEENLVRIYRDPAQHIVIRDYALQHLSKMYDTTKEGKDLILGVLVEALGETGSSIAGTALLGLNSLAAAHPEIPAGQVRTVAAQLTQEPGASELTRITAVQVCAQQNLTEVLPSLAALARSAESIPLRISAIGAIGQMGSTQEVSVLKEILEEKNQRLTSVATLALSSLQSRFTPQ